MAACIVGVLCTLVVALYLANGQISWLWPGKTAVEEIQDNNPSAQAAEEEPKRPVLRAVPFGQRLDFLKKTKRLWVFGAALFLGAIAFYAYRQAFLVDSAPVNIKYMVVLFLFVSAAVIDRQFYIIPNQIPLAGLAVWVALVSYAIAVEKNSVFSVIAYSVLGFLFAGGVLLCCRLLMKGSMGWGDIKFMAVIGMICGFHKTFNILFYSLLILFVAAIVLLITKKANRRTKLPMAPFLLMGFLAANLIAM